jgi:hypothetical protein
MAENVKIIGVLSYPKLFQTDKNGKYTTSILVPPSQAPALATLDKLARAAWVEKFPKLASYYNPSKPPMRPIEQVQSYLVENPQTGQLVPNPLFARHVLITARSLDKPGVVKVENGALAPEFVESDIYPGILASVSITV